MDCEKANSVSEGHVRSSRHKGLSSLNHSFAESGELNKYLQRLGYVGFYGKEYKKLKSVASVYYEPIIESLETFGYKGSLKPKEELEAMKTIDEGKVTIINNINKSDLVISLFGLIAGTGLFFTGFFVNFILSVTGLGCIFLGLLHLAWASK